MGCAASSGPKPINVEQMTLMCQDCCIRMEIICVTAAFKDTGAIKIPAPPQIQQLRDNVVVLRKQAAEVESGEALKTTGAAPAKPAAGGMLGSALGAMESAANKVQDLAAGAAGAAASKVLTVLADNLDKAVTAAEEPFNNVAKDVLKEKASAVSEVLCNYINGFKFSEPVKIVRGDTPWSAAQYKSVPGDAISKSLSFLAKDEVIAKIMPLVDAAVDQHPVTSSWKTANDTFNACCDGFGKEACDKASIQKMDLDLKKYIVEQIWNEICKLMEAEEIATRANPQGKEKQKPVVFAKVFSPASLTEQDYNDWQMVAAA